MTIDKKLNKVFKDLKENPKNTLDSQITITIKHSVKRQSITTSISPGKEPEETIPVVTLHFGDQYAQFHGEFIQTAYKNPELKPLLGYLEKENWSTNFD